jgi:signal transduction histidine kinase/ActR/RegA family two-component response regulator
LEHLDTLDLCVALSSPPRRLEAARALAHRCGVDEILIFVRDSQVGSLIPAPGFPQTLAGGGTWRSFLRECASPGRCEGDVEIPRGVHRHVVCIVYEGVAAVFLGGAPHESELALIERVMPMLSQALVAEQAARFASAAAADARSTASRARSLADALEAARAEQARLNARLHDEHRRKDDFLAMLAHELRNPLTPLVTSIELIRRANGVATEKHLAIMSRQVRQLSRLVEDLLDVSRVSRNRIELRCHRLRLADVVSDALDASRPFLESRRHRIELDLAREDIYVHADNVRLAQVFANLLHNAGKYTDPGGSIRVSSGCEGDQAFVRVEDNGVGIEPLMLQNVFDLFAQAPMSLDRAQGGLGIGLTLVRALVELHGGTVDAYSEGLGHGSTFTVHLPVAAPATSAASPPAPPPVADRLDRPLRVLVVDDNEDAANSLADVLRIMGHHAEVAFSGLKGMHMAEDVEPDLVLLDIGLPEIDGYEIARRLRRSTRRPVRLVAITGYGTEKDKNLSRDAGFDEHVVKPIMPEVIAGIIERVRAASRQSVYS